MATMQVSPYHTGVVSACLQVNKDSLLNISQEIWKRPETMFNEVFAHDTLTQYLQEQGFQVTPHYKVDPTAFRAEFQSAVSEELTSDRRRHVRV
ncbi:hypothetical protein RvY_00793-2 [Ramazzottius varieornatus]|uniref:Uncharacterized protein n=1 Tax=Ramazzottius varieornatus TaxID=947166 RepID=A0A1D1UEX0_RAMVA|nr:hypothetical protein RvY_00793-2 [Ramazzottius varieornatus]